MKANILKFPEIKEAVQAEKTTARKNAKPMRIRERNLQNEEAIMKATHDLVIAHGFAMVTEEAVIERAGVTEREYRRLFKNRDTLIRHFVEKNDYWLSDLKVGIVDTLGLESYLHQTLLNLMHALYEDRVMQRMLIWELDSDNKITRHVARLRETENRKLIEYFQRQVARTGVDVPALGALLVSGIYYLVMHSGRSTFCGVDFSTPKGKKRFANAISFAVKSIFDKHSAALPKGSTEPALRLVKDDEE